MFDPIRPIPRSSERCTRVLDIGCGPGVGLDRLRQAGYMPIGLDPDANSCRKACIVTPNIVRGQAEYLPFASGSADGVTCSLVLPYTDEAIALAEIARVLKPGARAIMTYHGFGYGLRYLFRRDSSLRFRFYGFRMILNTWWHGLTGKRAPGFLGDSLCQLRGQLSRYYARNGLTLIESAICSTFWKIPVIIAHTIEKRSVTISAQSQTKVNNDLQPLSCRTNTQTLNQQE